MILRIACLVAAALAASSSFALAHGITGANAAFVAEHDGAAIIPFFYLGAKHMVTGYDHLLFLLGVIFFLYRLRDILLYVTLFSLGHSLTLLGGVLGGVHVNAYLVDAIIGLSIVYKAFDNLGGFQKYFGITPNTKAAVFAFGLAHGFGLATKLQALAPRENGLITNMLSFNVGVEVGQILALLPLLGVMLVWRDAKNFKQQATYANIAIMAAGVAITINQLGGYFLASGGPHG